MSMVPCAFRTGGNRWIGMPSWCLGMAGLLTMGRRSGAYAIPEVTQMSLILQPAWAAMNAGQFKFTTLAASPSSSIIVP